MYRKRIFSGVAKAYVDFLFIVTPIVGVCNCSMFCCTLLYVHFSIAIILMGKRELIALLNLSSWCLVMVEQLFLTVPRGCLQFVIVVFPDHTYLLFLLNLKSTTPGHCNFMNDPRPYFNRNVSFKITCLLLKYTLQSLAKATFLNE